MANQPVNHKPHTGGGNRGLTQAYELRDLAANEAMAFKGTQAKNLSEKLARAKALQALSVVWLGASDRIRILRGRPLPGSKRPAPEVPKPKRKPITLTGTEEP